MLHVTAAIQIPDGELHFDFVRSSGPGGQNVNKVASKAVLRWNLTGSPSLDADVKARFAQRFARRLTRQGDVIVVSQRYRDQARNADDCREKLRAMLVEAARPPKRRRPTKPTQASRAVRLLTKKHQAGKKAGRRAVDGDE